jgi:F1F0 ATPase subunit 2
METKKNMNELVAALVGFFVGLFLGGFYFGGLLWTVNKGLRGKRKVLLFISSYVVRMVCVGVGFYMVGGSSWLNFVTSLVGFLIARSIVIHFGHKVRYESGT